MAQKKSDAIRTTCHRLREHTETMTDDRQKKPLTEAQLRQRREAAAKSTGPRTQAGKAASSRNAWKTGEHSAATRLIRQQWGVGALGKPCRRTCGQYPCSLVDAGHTQPGGDCLDKTVYMAAFDRLITSLQSGSADPMQDVLAAEAAGALEILHRLREEIAEHGMSREIPAVDKDGNVIMHEGRAVPAKIIDNPAIGKYIALLDRLGINLPELLATPRSVSKAGQGDDAVDAVAELLAGAARAGLRRPVTVDQDGDQ